jgi:hypothetical protein
MAMLFTSCNTSHGRIFQRRKSFFSKPPRAGSAHDVAQHTGGSVLVSSFHRCLVSSVWTSIHSKMPPHMAWVHVQETGGDGHLPSPITSSTHNPVGYRGTWSWRGLPSTYEMCVWKDISWKLHLIALLKDSKQINCSLATIWVTHSHKQPMGITSTFRTCKVIQDASSMCGTTIRVDFLNFWVSMIHWVPILTILRIWTFRDGVVCWAPTTTPC